MSLIPLLFSDWCDNLDGPHRLLDQDFGLGIYPEQLVTPRRVELYMPKPQLRSNYLRPWAELLRGTERGGSSSVEADKDNFKVTLDVQQFSPNEINVSTKDNYIIVNAKHEEKQDEHGFISREFTRKYLIPETCNLEKAESKLSSDGVLSIVVPKKEKPKAENEKVIKIEQTGKPALKPKESSDKKKEIEEKK
ncbi:protein lethal(2)essential for life [Copidosoma floridanum]|uniref:protein lethal(2)essential for life n=1 Tax=Copidosoma floridanum TaxID=29053 RepID=UPI0006C96947|nr:protein lethal(2)essential for life [Copidosoma floridanum]